MLTEFIKSLKNPKTMHLSATTRFRIIVSVIALGIAWAIYNATLFL